MLQMNGKENMVQKELNKLSGKYFTKKWYFIRKGYEVFLKYGLLKTTIRLAFPYLQQLTRASPFCTFFFALVPA